MYTWYKNVFKTHQNLRLSQKMRMTMTLAYFVLFLHLPLLSLFAQQVPVSTPPTVTAYLMGQTGNNLFQVATACSLAWDHHTEAAFFLSPNSTLYKHFLFRCRLCQPDQKVNVLWKEPSYAYTPIPYHPNMQIFGYFQSEKYFAHHREQILKLFAPHPDDMAYIQSKYQEILKHPKSVGVQVRYYKGWDPQSKIYPQYGKEYLEKAMSLFPSDSLFVVTSDNLSFTKERIPSWVKNVVFIENEPDYISFYLQSLCKHNIISHSSFGWWAAWLNTNPNKMVVHPAVWVYGLPYQDVCPASWIAIHAPSGE